MKEGAKWRLYIPPSWLTRTRGRAAFPPHSNAVFDIELLKVL